MILAVLAMASSAQAFTLEISGSATGSGWASNNVTVNYDPSCASYTSIQTALSQAVAIWSTVPASNLSVSLAGSRSLGTSITTYTGTGATQSYVGNILVYCDTNFDSDFSLSNPSDIPGLELSPTLNCSSGETFCPIEGGLVVLNVDTSDESNLSNYSQAKVSIVVTHELGHALGFGHSSDTSAVMYYDVTNKTTLKLAQDDANAAAYLYPRNEVGGSGIFGCGSLALIGGSGGSGPTDKRSGGSRGGQAEVVLFLGALLAIVSMAKVRLHKGITAH